MKNPLIHTSIMFDSDNFIVTGPSAEEMIPRANLSFEIVRKHPQDDQPPRIAFLHGTAAHAFYNRCMAWRREPLPTTQEVEAELERFTEWNSHPLHIQ